MDANIIDRRERMSSGELLTTFPAPITPRDFLSYRLLVGELLREELDPGENKNIALLRPGRELDNYSHKARLV
jgi:hypothetical protein